MMPFYHCDENGKCCWCHKSEPTRQAWDWMICEECFRELETEEREDRKDDVGSELGTTPK
jgi:hypothetical protein